jgi:hypothetical protein
MTWPIGSVPLRRYTSITSRWSSDTSRHTPTLTPHATTLMIGVIKNVKNTYPNYMKTTLILLTLHYFADQVLQSKSVQHSKHNSAGMLLLHVATWMIPMIAFGLIVYYYTGNVSMIAAWPMSIGVIHFIAEYVIGKVAESYLHKGDEERFVMMLFLEHLVIMLWTATTYHLFLNYGGDF